MREIKFRAWDKKNKKWIGSPTTHVCVSDGVIVIVKYAPHPNGTWEPKYCKQLTWDEIESLEIVEYTGLKDKNGKEIYEGDICKWQTYINDNDIEEQIINEVKFEGGGFTFSGFWIAESMPEAIEGSTIEVIGNIYENPELLGEPK